MRNFHLPGRSTVHALNAMVATSHPLAALTAIEVLRAGGTAADAAVAACALLGVIEPQSTGIGGDCFALIQPRGEGKISAYNGSGRAPMAATPEWYLEHSIKAIPLTSPHAVTIPGAVDAWTVILRDHGKFGLDRLLQPAIKAAEEGYVVAPRIAFDWHNQFEKLEKGTNTGRYLLPHGRPAVAGDLIRQPELGQTLRAIAKDGRDAFYNGPIAEDMVETLRAIGGLHTLDDFAAHTTETTAPIGTMYKGLDVWQCPPNGPGITMLVMLTILSRFDLTKFPAMSVERFHLEAEAARVAYMMREQHIGDPAFVKVDFERIRRAVCRQDQDGPASRLAESVAADESVDGLHHRGGQGPQRLFVHQFDRACLRCGDRLQQDRHSPAKSRRRFPRAARPSQLHRAGQAAAADHHSRSCHQGRPGGDAVRGDGRAVSAGRAGARFDQHARLWLRRAGGDRYAARPALRKYLSARGRRARRYRRGPEEARASDHPHRPPAWRRSGDLDRLGEGHAYRRLRSTQGRLRARLLSKAAGAC